MDGSYVYANSVSEFLAHLDSIEHVSMRSSTVSCYTFFRGQANKDWSLSPSLFRRNLFNSESLLLTELQHICPKEFLENRFETLVKFQHFGLPTRLMDTTTNPLVALFFACKSFGEADKDGIVYIFPNLPVSWSTDPLVDLIMDYVFEHYPNKLWLDQILSISMKKYANVVHRLMPDNIQSLLQYYTIPAFAVMPVRSNERIEAQDGAFFIFGMKVRQKEVSNNPGTLNRIYYSFDPAEIESPTQISTKATSIIIPSAAKSEILRQLDIVGINERKLFPDLEHQIQYTIHDILDNRLRN